MRPVSVIIVSHGRTAALKRCLTGVSQLYYPSFEIVVVADGPSVRMLKNSPLGNGIKTAQQDAENISLARNAGIALAAGEVVAFIDDDAVPEPTWLTHLAAAFDDDEVAAAGGFVRGRNGISFQWRASSVDTTGQRHPIAWKNDLPAVLHPPEGYAIKTEGTNMAFRREILAGIGGFDPAFRFFLDETDLNMRLARAGHATAIVPRAEVHHGFAESTRRRADRVPRDLFEIGASNTAFLIRHCPEGARAAAEVAFSDEQRKRLLQHMVAGRLEPRDIRRLLLRLKDGAEAGRARAPAPMPALPHASAPFAPRPPRPYHAPKLHVGRWRDRTKIRQKAAHDVTAGHVATALIFSFTSLFGRVVFNQAGVWEHHGGQFGRWRRTDPLFRLRRLATACKDETGRVRRARGLAGAKTDGNAK